MNGGGATRPTRADGAAVTLLPTVVDDLHRVTARLDALLADAAATRQQAAVSLASSRRRDLLARSDARTP